MATCTSCGKDVTGKKFCPDCGTAVQASALAPTGGQAICPRCSGEVKAGAAFCMHCGAALHAAAQTATPTAYATPTPPPPPVTHTCPACSAQVPQSSVFCNQCGHDTRVPVAPQGASTFCTTCGRQNEPGVRFCGGCGNSLTGATSAATTGYGQSSGQYAQTPYSQAQYPSQQPYSQQQPYQQYPPSQYPAQYGQQPMQGGYQPQPMLGQQPMVLRCPVCQAMAPMGTTNCVSCRTSLVGIVPTPANMPMQGQQGGMGGMFQGNAGKYAMGALGGAAAVLGGEMLLHGVENSIENRVEGDMGYGYRHHHHRDEGLLGGLGELADDIGL